MDGDTNNPNPGPQVIEQIIGQRSAVQVLKIGLESYFNDRATLGDQAPPWPHTLISGSGGLGKTMIAECIAASLGEKLHTELAQNILTPGHLHGLLLMLDETPGGISCLFIDEIHELPPPVMTTLLRALEGRKLFLGGDRKAITLPPFSLLGATTEPYALTDSLEQRFRIHLHLTHYTTEELVLVLRQRAKRLGWAIEEEALVGIAMRGRGVPRCAIRILESSRRTCRSENANVITNSHLSRTLEVECIDELGLDRLQRAAMEILRDAQQPVRQNVLCSRLGVPRKTLERCVERELLRLGLISKSETGRMLTAAGAKHLNPVTKSDQPKAV